MTIKRVCLAGVLIATALPLSGCSTWGCNKGFASSFAPGASGPATPRAALDAWLAGDHEGAPDGDWHRIKAASPDVGFRSGGWDVIVVKAPAGGYLVGGGSCSDTR